MTVEEFLRALSVPDDASTLCYLVNDDMEELVSLLPQPGTPIEIWGVELTHGLTRVNHHHYTVFMGVKYQVGHYPGVVIQLAEETLFVSSLGGTFPCISIARLEGGLILLGHPPNRIICTGFLLKWAKGDEEE